MNKQEIERAWQRVCMWIGCTPKEETEAHEVYQTIKKTLEQQLTGGWIAISERWPDKSGHYLVTYHEWTDGNYLPKYDEVYVRISRYLEAIFRLPVCVDEESEKDIHREVLAWQSLPEPYKEG